MVPLVPPALLAPHEFKAFFSGYFFMAGQPTPGHVPMESENVYFEHTEQLPKEINRQAWLTHGMDVNKLSQQSRSQESEARSFARTSSPPRSCRELLKDIREGPAMWLGLRKHLSVEDTEEVLRVLQEHSGWKDVKKSDDERLRKDYLTLFDECKYYDPQGEHTEMKRRKENNRIVVAPPAKPGPPQKSNTSVVV